MRFAGVPTISSSLLRRRQWTGSAGVLWKIYKMLVEILIKYLKSQTHFKSYNLVALCTFHTLNVLSKLDTISSLSLGACICSNSPSVAFHEATMKPVRPSISVICPLGSPSAIHLADGETVKHRTEPEGAVVSFHSRTYSQILLSMALTVVSAVPAKMRLLGVG